MENRLRLGPREWALLLTLSLLWGGSFFCNELALTGLTPPWVATGRVGLAALALGVVLAWRGPALPRDPAVWGRLAVMGLLNNALPIPLILWGQTRLSGGAASLLNATTPLWTVFLAHVLTRDEPLTRDKLAGALLGLVGVGVFLGPDLGAGDGQSLLAQAAVLGGAVCYACAGIWGRRLAGLPPLVCAAGQLGSAGVMLLVASLVWAPAPAWPGPVAGSALVVLALVSTALAYVIYFRILAVAGAGNLLLVTLLIPVSAMALGALFLGERPSPAQLAGGALIAAALAASDGRPRRALAGWLARRRAPKETVHDYSI